MGQLPATLEEERGPAAQHAGEGNGGAKDKATCYQAASGSDASVLPGLDQERASSYTAPKKAGEH